MSEAIDILKEVINQGGLLGRIAEFYINDEDKARQFLIECSDYCNGEAKIGRWDTSLTKKIIVFKNKVKTQ